MKQPLVTKEITYSIIVMVATIINIIKTKERRGRRKEHGKSSALHNFPLISGYIIYPYGCPRDPFTSLLRIRNILDPIEVEAHEN